MTSTESCGGKPRQIVRIGLIATLTGPGGTIGTGIRNSLEAALDRAEERITNCAIDLQLFVQNDCSDPLEAIRCAEKCMNAGCMVVIGPNDSASMSAVIKDKRFAKLPKFSTLATATDLSKQSCRSFFRFTTPNDARVEKLVLKMIELHPQRRCYLFSLVASHESYSQSLRRDVHAAANRHQVELNERPFEAGLESKAASPENRFDPIIICAPSANAVALITYLRLKGFRGHVFAFGSNSNFLVKHALGTVVVCDLDRHDPDPLVQKALAAIADREVVEKDPSIPTIVAIDTLVDLLSRRPISAWADVAQGRREVVNLLHRTTLQGLLGPIGFSPSGEMVGHENITLLTVARKKRGLGFSSLRESGRPDVYYESERVKRAIRVTAWFVGFVGFISAVTGLLSYFSIGPDYVTKFVEKALHLGQADRASARGGGQAVLCTSCGPPRSPAPPRPIGERTRSAAPFAKKQGRAGSMNQAGDRSPAI